MPARARLKPLFLSFLAWLFEDEAYALVHSGRPIGHRRIFHNVWVIRAFCWMAMVLPLICAGGVFWLMGNMPYFTISVLVFSSVVAIFWSAWKIEVHRDTRDEVAEVDHYNPRV